MKVKYIQQLLEHNSLWASRKFQREDQICQKIEQDSIKTFDVRLISDFLQKFSGLTCPHD